MSAHFEQLLDVLMPSFQHPADFVRTRRQWLAGLLNLGRHTVTGSLATAGRQQRDWSADYRALQRLPVADAFAHIRREVLARTTGPWVVALDDSCTRKTGRLIPGCGWRRDPQSPPFHVNFTWGQRVLQFSAAVPAPDGSARLVPVDWVEAPLPRKPARGAPTAQQQAYREARKQANLNLVAVQRMAQLRLATNRVIHFVSDGRFTNRTLLRQLPTDSVLIGRVRKDSKLHALCTPRPSQNGRPKRYGTILPTPEQLRVDPSVPWTQVRAWACGREHDFKIKTTGPALTRMCGVERSVQIIVIAPLAYRLRQGGRLLYRQPAFLLCTDPVMPIAQILQEYLWRWDIEVNFHDEKSLLGVSEAQVRQPEAVQRQPAGVVAAYALLLLAAHSAYGHDRLPPSIPLPKWRQGAPPRRATTALLLNQLRLEYWAACLRRDSFSQFMSRTHPAEKPSQPSFNLAHAVFNARN